MGSHANGVHPLIGFLEREGLSAGKPRQFVEDFGSGRLSYSLSRYSLDEEARLERLGSLFAQEGDFVSSRFGGLVATFEGSPAFGTTACEFDRLRFARWGFDAGSDVSLGQGFAAGLHDVGSQGQCLSDARSVGRKIEPHRFAFGHVALVSHPADDLAPEPIVVLVLDPFSPSPNAVGAHEEDFACPEGFGCQKSHASLFSRRRFVDGQDFDSRLGSRDGRVPLKARQVHPDIDVVFGRIGEFGQETFATGFGQLHAHGVSGSDSVGIRRIEDHRHERFEGCFNQAVLAALGAGHEDQTAGLKLDEAADHLALLLGQLPFVDSDIAEEDDVVFGKLFESRWEFFDVVFAPPADTVEIRMEEQA